MPVLQPHPPPPPLPPPNLDYNDYGGADDAFANQLEDSLNRIRGILSGDREAIQAEVFRNLVDDDGSNDESDIDVNSVDHDYYYYESEDDADSIGTEEYYDDDVEEDLEDFYNTNDYDGKDRADVNSRDYQHDYYAQEEEVARPKRHRQAPNMKAPSHAGKQLLSRHQMTGKI